MWNFFSHGEESDAPETFPAEEFQFDGEEHGDVAIPLHQLVSLPVEQLPPTPATLSRSSSIGTLLTAAVSSGFTAESTDTVSTAPPIPERWGPQKRNTTGMTLGEVKIFYEKLSEYGTDFNFIALHLPNRTRRDVKRLYSRELKRNPTSIARALEDRRQFNETEVLEKIIEKRKSTAAPVRELGKEEEVYLKEIEEDVPSPTADALPSSKRLRSEGETGVDRVIEGTPTEKLPTQPDLDFDEDEIFSMFDNVE